MTYFESPICKTEEESMEMLFSFLTWLVLRCINRNLLKVE